jgi:hypothetical protein
MLYPGCTVAPAGQREIAVAVICRAGARVRTSRSMVIDFLILM